MAKPFMFLEDAVLASQAPDTAYDKTDKGSPSKLA
jgi:hypothetical protein